MLVKCTAKECKYNNNEMCIAESISIVDIEEKENIKLKENDYMACNSFEWKY